jgi:hypothetical protein
LKRSAHRLNNRLPQTGIFQNRQLLAQGAADNYALDINHALANSTHPEQTAEEPVGRNLQGPLNMKLAPDSLRFHIFERP